MNRAMIRILAQSTLVTAIAVFVGACGEVTATPTVRVSIVGTSEQQPLDIEDGTVDVEGDAILDRALIRIARMQLDSDTDVAEMTAPLNVDLFNHTVLWEGVLTGDRLTKLRLEVPSPPGDGVIRGAGISVYMSGLLYDQPFEYRDVDMLPIEVPLDIALDGSAREVQIDVDLNALFASLVEADLELDVDESYQLDAAEGLNSSAATTIEAALRQAFVVAPIATNLDSSATQN